jgi:hypothetical protein
MSEPDGPRGHHKHTAEEERKIREAALDETIEASFPASDPPSTDPNPDDHDACDESRRPPKDESSKQEGREV